MHRKTLLAIAVMLMLAAGAQPALAHDRVEYRGPLTDLSVGTNPTDGAWARVRVVEHKGQTTIRMRVSGLDRDAAGTTLGAHVHVGQCIQGNGTVAGPHYNTTGLPDTAGRVVSDDTEVWLDFTLSGHGRGYSSVTVGFTIPTGEAASIVIHEMATDPSGAAGARLACLPVEF